MAEGQPPSSDSTSTTSLTKEDCRHFLLDKGEKTTKRTLETVRTELLRSGTKDGSRSIPQEEHIHRPTIKGEKYVYG